MASCCCATSLAACARRQSCTPSNVALARVRAADAGSPWSGATVMPLSDVGKEARIDIDVTTMKTAPSRLPCAIDTMA